MIVKVLGYSLVSKYKELQLKAMNPSKGEAQRHVPVIPGLRRQKQEDLRVLADIGRDSVFKPHPTHELTCAHTPWNISIHPTNKRKKEKKYLSLDQVIKTFRIFCK